MATLTYDDNENERIVEKVLQHTYDNKGGFGVAACIAIVNDSMYELVEPDSSSFWGRWERDPQTLIAPGEVANVVHRKVDAGASGCQGYLEYRLRRNNEDLIVVYCGWSAPWGPQYDPSVGCSFRALDTILTRESREKVSLMSDSDKRYSTTYTNGGIKLTLTIKLVTTDKSPRIVFSIVQNHRYTVRNRTPGPMTLRIGGKGKEGEETKQEIAAGGELNLSVPRSDVTAPIAFEFPGVQHVWRWATERGVTLIVEDKVLRQYPKERVYLLKVDCNGDEIPLGHLYTSALTDPKPTTAAPMLATVQA